MGPYLTVSDNRETILIATVEGRSIRWEVAFEVPEKFRGVLSKDVLGRLAEAEHAIARSSMAEVEMELMLAT